MRPFELNLATVFGLAGQGWSAAFRGDDGYLPAEAHGNFSVTVTGRHSRH